MSETTTTDIYQHLANRGYRWSVIGLWSKTASDKTVTVGFPYGWNGQTMPVKKASVAVWTGTVRTFWATVSDEGSLWRLLDMVDPDAIVCTPTDVVKATATECELHARYLPGDNLRYVVFRSAYVREVAQRIAANLIQLSTEQKGR